MSTIIVGFGHKARQGKDTAADAILKARGGVYDIRRYAFADAMKREYVEKCKEAGGAHQLISGLRVTHSLPSWVQYEFDASKDDPICGEWGKQRTLLQWWGGDYRRSEDSLYWVKKLAKQIHADDPQIALVSDMRYRNEAAFIKMCGGYTVKVSREGYAGSAGSHPSERDLDKYPFDFALLGEEGKKEELESLAVGFFDWLIDSLNPKPVTAFGGANVLEAA